MQEDTGTKHSPAKLSGHGRPHFIAAPAVFHPRRLCQNEASPWKQNAPDHMITEGQSPAVSFGLLLNGNTSTDTTSAVEHGPKTSSGDASSTTSEPDTRAGGSIRDRIAALSAAAGVSRLNVTPGREQSRVDVITGREQSKEASEKGVAFDVEFQKAPKPRPPPRLTSRFRTKDLERKDEPASDTRVVKEKECGVVNNRELGAVNDREFGAVTNRELGAVNSRELRAVNNREFGVEYNKKFGAVNNQELGVVGDKSVAFEVCFDDQPRSKRSKEEVCLMQSPFKAFKTRSNRRYQQKSSVKIQLQQTNVDEGSLICAQNDDWKDNRSVSSFCSDAVSVEKETSNSLSVDRTSSQRATQQEDFKMRGYSEVPNLQKRNTFTVDSVSQFTGNASDQDLPIVQALNELANKETSKPNEQERGSNSEILKLQKRNTFTLDSASQYIDNTSGQGVLVAKALNELDSETESKNAEDKFLPSELLQKRTTFTLDSVSRDGLPIVTVLNELASKEETKQNKQCSVLPDETTQKRGTFTLDSVSQSIENASEEGLHVATVLNDLASKEELKQNRQRSDDSPSALPDETSLKRSTFTLESVSQEIDSAIEKYFTNESVNITTKDSTSAENQDSLEKRSTSSVESVSLSFQSEADESLPANEVLSQPTKQDELQTSRMLDTEEAAGKRGTFTLDSVSQTLEEAQDKGLPAVHALHQLASEEERHLSTETLSVPSPPQNRGTYTLDTVSHAIEEAVEKGIPVSVTLNHLAQDHQHTHAHDCKDVAAGELTLGFKRPDARVLSSEPRDEFEASFEDALEQLEDCVTCDSGEEFSTFSNRERPFSETPGKRGTYDLEDVSTSLQDDAKDSVPVVVTLDRLSRSGLPKDSSTKNQPYEEKRGTYTLDEVSRSLQTAEVQGIPVVEALQNLTRNKEVNSESAEIEESAGKRGTYTLNEVSKSLEHAEKTGIPVVDALEALCKDTPKSPLRLKIPDRGTYNLDKVSLTLEHAKQKGLPIVYALGHLTASKDSPIRQTPDAVHRRQGKLINRKTYALASPLETIGEGTKLRLYDGSKKQMMSPISFHVKSKEATASEPSGNDNKVRGLGVVQKLDFLTSACERLLEANAKEMGKDQQLTESTRNCQTSDEFVAGSHEAPPEAYSCQPERNTYSLDSVSVTIDDAKAKGIPVVDTLKNVTSVAKPTAIHRTNLMRLNSKSDSEIVNDGSKKETSDRNTHSLENVSRTLEDAKKAGIPVIEALDQLTNELAEFSLTAMSGDLPMTPSGRDNRKRKRYSETAIKEPYPSPHGSPYPPPIRKAYSLGDVAFAVQQAFQSGTSLDDLLDGIAFEKPAEPVMSSSKDVRPRSVDSGFVSSFSDNDISSQSFESSRNRTNTYILDSSNEDLDLVKLVAPVKDLSFDGKNTTGSSNVNQDSNRRTFTLDHVSELTRDIPVIEALEKLSNSIVLQTDNTNQLECNENAKNLSTDAALPSKSNSGRKKSPPKPKRQFFKKAKSPQSISDSFVVEIFDSNAPQQATSKFQIVNDKVEQISKSMDPDKDLKEAENSIPPSSVSSIEKNPFNDRQISMDKHLVDIDLVPTRDPDTVGLKSKEPVPISSSTPTRARATWRPSGSVLDKIASLMDAAEDCGMSPADVLNQANDLRSDAEGEIEELEQDEAEDEQALTSQLAYLRMQLDEKRRHIEAEKHRAQSEWEDQRRRVGQTAFWYVMGKAQGGQTVGEGPGSEVLHSDKGPVMKPQSHEQPRKPVTEFPDQPSPPIAWSSPANSPLPASASHPRSNGQQFETREFRLSDYPPGNELGTNQDMTRPSSQPAVEVSSRPTPIPPRPSSHDPAAHHMAPARRCWNVDAGQTVTPLPLVRSDTASINMDTKQETVSPVGGGTAEIEVENQTPLMKGLAMFIGDDASPASQCLTPEQEKKREKFMRLRQKKQEEDRTRKEAELEKKRRREGKQREKEMLQKMEEERLRQEELERQRAKQELRIREAQVARVPDSFSTYRHSGPRQQVYNINDDANSYYDTGPTQPSSFAEFSGPQCYVKPSGKSNRKIIVNAISHVCLSGTVNQDQKEKCLQAISEHDGHHFLILFKDGLKFRGIYVHNLDNDQLFKVFGIGPRVVTSKMLEFLYKYNSGGKEFTKIPSKTISISVDGFAIQKSCWNTGKPVVSSKTASNLKRPPRPPQR